MLATASINSAHSSRTMLAAAAAAASSHGRRVGSASSFPSQTTAVVRPSTPPRMVSQSSQPLTATETATVSSSSSSSPAVSLNSTCSTSANCTNGFVCHVPTGTCVRLPPLLRLLLLPSSTSSSPSPCANRSDCPFGWDCNTTAGLCVEITCTTDAHCHGQVCDETTGTCVNVHSFCQKNADCSGGQFCNTATRECVSCTTSANCVLGTECNVPAGECVDVTCRSNQDCLNVSQRRQGSSSSSIVLVCDPNLGTCVDAVKLATSRGSHPYRYLRDSVGASLILMTTTFLLELRTGLLLFSGW